MFLSKEELPAYYPKAKNMEPDDLVLYLQRANAYAFGAIGGIPPFTDALTQDNLKIIIALLFELYTRDETAQIDEHTGNITEAAPEGFFTQSNEDAFAMIDKMLIPYATAYAKLQQEIGTTDRGIMFL
jgi:hypothetical protein